MEEETYKDSWLSELEKEISLLREDVEEEQSLTDEAIAKEKDVVTKEEFFSSCLTEAEDARRTKKRVTTLKTHLEVASLITQLEVALKC